MRPSWSLAIVPLGVLCVALAVVFAVRWLYAERAFPGVTVAGVDVGSLDRSALRARLEDAAARTWTDAGVSARYGDRVWHSTNGALGITPDLGAAADGALAFGKSGSLLDQLGAWGDALRGDADVALTFRGGDALEAWLVSLAHDIDAPARPGALSVGAGGVLAVAPVVGAQLDRPAAIAGLLGAHTFGDRSVALPVRPVYPEVDASGYAEAAARAAALTTPVVVAVGDRRVPIDASALASLLVIERVAAREGELAALPTDAIAPAQRYRYTVTLDDARLRALVAGLASQLDRPSVNARYTVSRDGALDVVPGVLGIDVDREALRTLLARVLVTPAATDVRAVAAPSLPDAAAFTTDQARRWLPQLVKTSSFTTYFTPSPARHANIATGSSQFDGVVVQPGETFSFWDRLGPVTVERGYAYAGAIINNRSDENVIGGGLCQVSTTMFNAVARVGYEIVERHAHGYLIERYPLGLDAAVFSPGVDFRWRNDTSSPVFLWSWVSPTSVTFDVWGLPTGRDVTFTAPVQRNFRDVPPTQAADPAFPTGYAVRGRDAWITRTVTAADGTAVHLDTFFSHYAPVWGGPAATMTIR